MPATQTATEKVARRPFHETIVDAIQIAEVTEFGCFQRLIKTTKIPKNHTKIISAIEKRFGSLGLEEYVEELKTVLLDQKAEVEAEEVEKAKKVRGGGY